MRLNDLFEKTKQAITLFRGDSAEIEKFFTDKADAGALVGRGIYLTTSFDVAKDYTVKGQKRVLYRSEEGMADDPRGFLQDQFRAMVAPKVNKLLDAYRQTVQAELNRMTKIFQQEIANTIGIGQDAMQHPRYTELQNWMTTARSYAEARAYKASEKIFLQHVRSVYDQEYQRFKKSFEGTRMLTTVLDEIIVIPEDSIGHVSRFRVPKFYLDRFYEVDAPMPDWLLKWYMSYVGTRIEGFDPRSTKIDLRYNDPETGEKRADSFVDWIDKFQEYGARFAWGEHYVGGQGENPTLLEIVYGTHLGQTIMYTDDYQFWEDLRSELEERGYVGLHYLGGNRTGTDTFTGGSPVKHDAYVLWDEKDANQFRINSKEIGIDATDTSLFKNFRFKHMVKKVMDSIAWMSEGVKNKSQVANADQIDAAIDEWLQTGSLDKKLEQAIETN